MSRNKRALLGGIGVAADTIDPVEEPVERQRLALEVVAEPLVERSDAALQRECRRQQRRNRFGASSRPSSSRPASRFLSDRRSALM